MRAALKLFGRQGYDGTSTREIASAAKANIGSIAYHFSGKEGLRAAVADHIVETIQSIADQALGGMTGPDPAALTPEAAREQLRATLQGMVAFIVAKPEAGEIVQFMLRELADPTPTLTGSMAACSSRHTNGFASSGSAPLESRRKARRPD